MMNAIDFYPAIKKGRGEGGGGGGNCSTALAIGHPEKGAWGGGGWGRQQTWGNKMI